MKVAVKVNAVEVSSAEVAFEDHILKTVQYLTIFMQASYCSIPKCWNREKSNSKEQSHCALATTEVPKYIKQVLVNDNKCSS